MLKIHEIHFALNLKLEVMRCALYKPLYRMTDTFNFDIKINNIMDAIIWQKYSSTSCTHVTIIFTRSELAAACI